MINDHVVLICDLDSVKIQQKLCLWTYACIILIAAQKHQKNSQLADNWLTVVNRELWFCTFFRKSTIFTQGFSCVTLTKEIWLPLGLNTPSPLQSQLIRFRVPQKSCFSGNFFAENCFSWPNCSLSTI